MTDPKQSIIEHLCYTDLVYKRINKKLSVNFSIDQIEVFIKKVLESTDKRFFSKKGKNFYVTNSEVKIRITINSNTFRVITVDRIGK